MSGKTPSKESSACSPVSAKSSNSCRRTGQDSSSPPRGSSNALADFRTTTSTTSRFSCPRRRKSFLRTSRRWIAPRSGSMRFPRERYDPVHQPLLIPKAIMMSGRLPQRAAAASGGCFAHGTIAGNDFVESCQLSKSYCYKCSSYETCGWRYSSICNIELFFRRLTHSTF